MAKNDLFADSGAPFGLPPVPGSNAPPELTVTELSQKLKRLVETEFSFVRVRGEISQVTLAKSGHLYTSLKDQDSVLSAICWKGSLAQLSVRPEEGLEVIVTGRLTTYPGRSNYQIIIETMELAGQGALLKMLEERKKKLAAEGLFDAARKKKLPYIPRLIGVITSPTGAVIRDIMHRLDDRFPRPVLIWPVMVQGKGAAEQVIAAINGFNALPPGSPHRPDLLIVARGGGSLEDLMPFNEESVVRAAAASKIPLISAIGHETDTTLIDFASDRRAPTPTGAAEMAVPVRAELLAGLRDYQRRMARGATRLLEMPLQRLDHLSAKLERALSVWLERKGARLRELAAKIAPQALNRRIADTLRIFKGHEERLAGARKKITDEPRQKLAHLSILLESLSFERVLDRGFALVTDDHGQPVTSVGQVRKNDAVTLRFKDGKTAAVIKDEKK